MEADDPRPFESHRYWKKHKLSRVTPEMQKGVNTTHFSIVDRFGNVVSYTTTIESAWGTGLMVPGYGFLLNNELTDFNFSPTANADSRQLQSRRQRCGGQQAPAVEHVPDYRLQSRKTGGGLRVTGWVDDHQLGGEHHHEPHRSRAKYSRGHRLAAYLANQRQWQPSLGSRFFAGSDRRTESYPPYGHNLADDQLSVIGSVQGVIISPVGKLQYGAADRRRVGGVVTVKLKEIEDCRHCGWKH